MQHSAAPAAQITSRLVTAPATAAVVPREQVDAVRMPRSAGNPHGNGFTAQETDLTSTSMAQRLTAPDRARIWKIKNPSTINPVSKAPVAYKLMPMGGGPTVMADDDSIVGRRAVFAKKHLWVTPHSDTQKFPAGDYVLQAEECKGLAVWTKEVCGMSAQQT